ncbi:diguanylate cyclase [Catellatospora sp. KI3]|nr:diguanylate cyclase [Catellatospora sp. KI3]MDI1464293.1 diguanylate cyclase [Catellatospora sp. KI3]
MPLNRIIDDVAAALRASRSAVEACGATVSVLSRHTPALIEALLHVKDQLRCVSASGAWQVFSAVPLGRGVVGRVYASGKAVTILDVANDPDYIRLGPPITAEICAPIIDRTGHPVGVLNAEWDEAHSLDGWEEIIIQSGRLLGARLSELGGPPPETRSEQLLRHSLALTSAETDGEVLLRACRAAREVTGLAAAVLLRPAPDLLPELADAEPDEAERSMSVVIAASSPEPRDRPLVARLAQIEPERLSALLDEACRYGASYTLGDPAVLDARGFEALTGAGVRTMIAVPLGASTPTVTSSTGALVVLDETAIVPDSAMVNLLELLAAQATSCLEKLSTLRRLHRQANSDPLTGLRHGGPFGARLAAATPGQTALLAIDIDEFKTVNDTLGHAAGDRVLVQMAVALQQALRLGDELFRVGGDEFVAVIDVPSAAEAMLIAERLLTAARATSRTISVGVAVQREQESPEAALYRADQALYKVKRAGRNGAQLAD